jgi:hypothetical protein
MMTPFSFFQPTTRHYRTSAPIDRTSADRSGLACGARGERPDEKRPIIIIVRQTQPQ